MPNLIRILISAVFLAAINVSDIKEYKIKNICVLPALLAGVAVSFFDASVKDALLGALIPLVLFPLFALRMLGAGDIKALCALGSLLGLRLSIYNMAFAFICGGIIALGFMIFGKNAKERFGYLFVYLKNCFLTRKLLDYNFGGSKGKFRFSFAITAGFLTTAALRAAGVI